MDIDWKLLVRVREQQRTRAQQRVVREREATQAAHARVNEARDAWQHEVDARSSLWSDLETAPGSLNMASLRQASAWSRTLDGRILQAAAAAQQAHLAAQQQQQQLDESRRALRGAAGGVHKAEQMRDRVRTEGLRVQATRMDEAVEESASQAWALGREPH
jgi:hypothetical protein